MSHTIVKVTPPTHQRWTPARITEAIRDRQNHGLPLNAQAVDFDDSRLIAAARRLFGCWNHALTATGIDPETVRPKPARHPHGFWSRATIIAAIRYYQTRSTRLNGHYMQHVDNPLVSAATYYFGSWSNALDAAGIDSGTARHNTPRSKDQILHAIGAMAKSHPTLKDFVAREYDRALYGAAQKYFGSWRNAVREAGYEGASRSANSRWSRQDIESLLTRYLASGIDLNEALRRHSHLHAAIVREWGSWKTFQQAYQAWSLGIQDEHRLIPGDRSSNRPISSAANPQ